MFEIRPAALSEFALLPAIEAEADTAFERLDPPLSTANFPAPAEAAEYAGAFHIMVAGRPPAGFVRLELVDGQAHLEQLAVSGVYSRQGIGRALIRAAQAWAREAGFGAMTLSTFAHVPFNAPLYASCGFVELPQHAWGPQLQDIRRREQAAGLDELGPRVVMVADLTAGDGRRQPTAE
ncbi:GNAT family N-acetyltransferase [Specibacter sp. NPDC057265]|uniref:GNAT family N-acetyltransferase n=1 Tax=Specibacter sp. NPDC057265 TaxID=3346075 RepID=UPI003632A325